MGAYKKLKWQKTLNEYKFLVEELSLVKSIGRATAVDFQQHYEDFLKSNDINLSELNEQHRDRIKEAYNVEEEDVCGDLPVIEASNTSLVVDKAEQPRDSEIQMTADEVAVHNMFSKLFKSIAVKIHPDKIDPLWKLISRKKHIIIYFPKLRRTMKKIPLYDNSSDNFLILVYKNR
jgi:uncharacterized protein YciI